jgi:two-component system phosphate regulon response regulator OmpR
MADRVLMIEDDLRLAEMLARYLGENGFALTARHDAGGGLRALANDEYAAVILDVMLPDLDGFEVCRRIRAQSTVPILMLTARGDPTDRVVGLELGADDYLPKPFEPRELVARLRAILRRSSARPAADGEGRTPPLRFGRLEIDRDAHVVRLDGNACELTSYQFELLRVLAENAGRVMSRDAIMDRLAGGAVSAFDRSIDVHVSRIRAAIEDDPKQPRRILTIRGAGYLFPRSQDEGT